jgi:hypothetical protein
MPEPQMLFWIKVAAAVRRGDRLFAQLAQSDEDQGDGGRSGKPIASDNTVALLGCFRFSSTDRDIEDRDESSAILAGELGDALVAPLAGSPVGQPDLGGAGIRRHVLEVLGVDGLAVVLHDLDRVVAVADGALIERALDAIVRRAFSDLERLAKVPVGRAPNRPRRDTEGLGKIGIGRAELAHLRRHLGVHRDVLGRASADRLLILGRLLALRFFLPRRASPPTGVSTFAVSVMALL